MIVITLPLKKNIVIFLCEFQYSLFLVFQLATRTALPQKNESSAILKLEAFGDDYQSIFRLLIFVLLLCVSVFRCRRNATFQVKMHVIHHITHKLIQRRKCPLWEKIPDPTVEGACENWQCNILASSTKLSGCRIFNSQTGYDTPPVK